MKGIYNKGNLEKLKKLLVVAKPSLAPTKKTMNIDKKLITILATVLLLFGIALLIKFYLIPNKILFKTDSTTQNVTREKLQALDKFDFSLDSGAYATEDITVISNFESDEETKWKGDGIMDEKLFYEGTRSLSLISTERKGVTASLEKNIDLTNMKYIEFMLHIADVDAFEAVTLDFGDLELNNYYRYTFSNLKNGWNLIQIPKEKFVLLDEKDKTFSWSSIGNVKFSILSRQASIFLIRIDMLRAINGRGDFLGPWRSGKPEMFFSLYEKSGKTKLMARSIGATVATFREGSGVKNFDYSASISPQSAGRSGLFVRGDYITGYGYYFLLGGQKKNTWQILKRSKTGYTPTAEIVQGTLEGIVFANDKNYWLRVTGKNNLLEFYFSTDGKQYEKLGKLNDPEFKEGGLGITVLDAGWSLFDNFHFKKN